MKENIKEAALEYMSSHETNFYAEDNNVTLYVGCLAVDVESIWRSKDDGKVYLHVGCKDFEGDLDIESLSEDNQGRMMKAFGIDKTRDRLWARVTNYVTLANGHLEQEGVKAQICAERHQQGEGYMVYVIYDGEDVDIKEAELRLEDVERAAERVWNDLIDTYCEDADDYCETVKLRRVSGDPFEGEANLIYGYADCPLFFIRKDGYIEEVGGCDIERFACEEGYFAVNACDYHEAMRQVYKHENGIDGN